MLDTTGKGFKRSFFTPCTFIAALESVTAIICGYFSLGSAFRIVPNVGLGAIGVLVANTCIKLGMKVYGYDPFISIQLCRGS